LIRVKLSIGNAPEKMLLDKSLQITTWKDKAALACSI
jgi:hypothetical protein